MFLHQLHQSWPDKKLIIILDNESMHKSKEVQKIIKKHGWVALFYLPPYSPEYNPIERFWHWLKQKVKINLAFSRGQNYLKDKF
jgi:transposase